MAFIGNKLGPRESEIINEIGHEFFGISPAALEEDISDFQYSESLGNVVPVHVDEEGMPYIIFSTPAGPQRFYLKGKYQLTGKISTYTKEETNYWNSRKDDIK